MNSAPAATPACATSSADAAAVNALIADDNFITKDAKFADFGAEQGKRNPYYEPKEGDYPMPGIDGIKRMQERGALFCVCDLAIAVYSGFAAKSMNLDPETVRKEWLAGILPGVQIVPSGVWALGRAQELGCGYIYAGG